MSIITFWNNTNEQVGTTASSMALAVRTALQHNIKILLVSTAFNDTTMEEGFWKPGNKKTVSKILGNKETNRIDQNGVEGLERLMKSNKITPQRVTEYTKILLTDRLEVLLGVKQKDRRRHRRNKKNIRRVKNSISSNAEYS